LHPKFPRLTEQRRYQPLQSQLLPNVAKSLKLPARGTCLPEECSTGPSLVQATYQAASQKLAVLTV
jgi:hypothetical protein